MQNLKKKYETEISFFRQSLLNWYGINGRSFPWRNISATNYELIISEILLQRTRAEQVSKFFYYFTNIYPSWRQLAKATRQELEEILKPLGLNKQRGIGLYNLAQEMKKRKGRFPQDTKFVALMPLMGKYNTRAFELFILKRNVPLFDINMVRLLERFFPKPLIWKCSNKYLEQIAYYVVDIKESKELNWAILDYASLICKKRNPHCELCILSKMCNYYIENKV